MTVMAMGLSPCVSGHHVTPINSCTDYGSIPMCMGPPLPPFCADPFYWVYPHVYGATNILAASVVAGEGLSPGVWGHLQPLGAIPIHRGSIPRRRGPSLTAAECRRLCA